MDRGGLGERTWVANERGGVGRSSILTYGFGRINDMVVNVGDRVAVAYDMAVHVGSLAFVASNMFDNGKCSSNNSKPFFWTLTINVRFCHNNGHHYIMTLRQRMPLSQEDVQACSSFSETSNTSTHTS